jgi:hypothetical protein
VVYSEVVCILACHHLDQPERPSGGGSGESAFQGHRRPKVTRVTSGSKSSDRGERSRVHSDRGERSRIFLTSSSPAELRMYVGK